MTTTDKPNEKTAHDGYVYERELLSEFARLVKIYHEDTEVDIDGELIEGSMAKEIRPGINRMLPAVQEILAWVGINTVIDWSPPPMVGGPPRRVDIITNIFNLQYFDIGMNKVVDYVDRALGLLEHLSKTGRLPSGQHGGEATAIELLSGLERAVRQAFTSPPHDEKRDLHPVVRVVLSSLMIPFTSEQERVAYAAGSAIPDFVLWDGKCTLEVKLLKETKDIARITTEMNDDILKYVDRFPRRIFLIYDCGTLRDVEAFRSEFMKHTGVFVLVVKH